MLFGLVRKQKILDEETIQWLIDTFEWSLLEFDAGVFFDESRLVIPTNAHFPGRVDSVDGMARLIFDHVRTYAGMPHWPFVVLDQAACALPSTTPVRIEGPMRGAHALQPPVTGQSGQIAVSYDPALVSNPEALIAAFAHALAHHLGQAATAPPPGGVEFWPQATEVLAIFMGFGLMFANSAFRVPVRSCGSCGPKADRRAYLTQHQSTYALALFCVLKEIPDREVLPHLKKALRPFYRQAVADIRERDEVLSRLRAVPAPQGASAILS